MKWLRRLPGVLLATCAVSQAWAQTLPLSYVPIEFPSPSGEIRRVSAPNNAGQIVGSIVDGSGHGFIYDHGSFTILDVPFPGALHTDAYGINNRGEVVGTYSTATTYHGFIWRSGVFTRFDVPSAVCCTALSGVNDSGEIIGWYADVNGFRAFLFSGDRFTPIEPPGAGSFIYGAVTSINNSNQIVGNYQLSNGSGGNVGPTRAFVYDYRAGQFTDIELPFPLLDIFVTGINDGGDVVGNYHCRLCSSLDWQGFVKRGGSSYRINVPDRQFAAGITASGEILETFSDIPFQGQRVYLATPLPSEVTLANDAVTFVPIPSTYSMAGACSLGGDRPAGELFKFVATLTVLDHATTFSDALIEVATVSATDKIMPRVIDGRGAFTPMPFPGAFAPVPRTGQYADGLLAPSESVDVTFGVCVPNRDAFELTVNVWGRQQP